MQHVDDRSLVLGALKQQLDRLEHLGFKRAASHTMRQHLAALAVEGVIASDTAGATADLYDECRFSRGQSALNQETAEALLATLEQEVADLESGDDATRTALVEQFARRAVPPKRTSALAIASRPPLQPSQSTRRQNAAPQGALFNPAWRKWLAERGSPRVWTFIACAVVLWTLAVMAGSLWQQDRIERLLASRAWSRSLFPRVRPEEPSPAELRRQYLPNVTRASLADFLTLARQYEMRGDYAEAIHAYRQGLARCRDAQQEAHSGNVLAWMLLTAPDPWYRDAKQAFPLAQRAVELERRPDYLNTLALAHYELGDAESAIQCEQQAIEIAEAAGESREHLPFFRAQQMRFQQRQPVSEFVEEIANH
jgi:tetratricopeptide (TPR) repeat protein